MEEELKKLIRKNNVIPFVGAGVSLAVQKVGSKEDNNIFPNWTKLLELLADGLKQYGKEDESKNIYSSLKVKKNNYLSIADDIKGFYPTDKLYNKKIEEIFDKEKEEIEDSSLDLARSIWDLNQKLVITTNYDKVLHWASNSPADTQRWDIQSVSEQASSLTDYIKKQTVWHLHGHIENKKNIILTTESYNRLYNNSMESEFQTAFNTLKIKLATKSFLFIGYSLDDKFFVNELEKINDIFENQSATHFILLKEGTTLPEQFNKKIIPIYYENRGQPLIDKIISLQSIPKIKKEPKEQENTPTIKEIYNSKHLTSLPKQNKEFIGRVEELEKIEEIFQNDSITYIVNGIGGVGKSELANAYFYKNKDKYNNIAFIELSEDGSSLEEIFLFKFKEKLHLDNDSTFDTLIQRLQGLPEKNLLLVDNLNTKEEFEKIEVLNSNFHILVTTRIKDISVKNQLNLETLNDEDAEKLFLSIYNKDENIKDILKYLDNHPLFINLTAKSLKEEYITLDELREEIKNNNIYKIDSKEDKTFEEHLNDRFDRQFKNESKKELKELLQILAIFPSIEIDFKILEKTITIDKLKVKLQKLVQRGWLNKKDDSYKLHQIIKTFLLKKYPIDYEDITFIFDNIASYIDTDDSVLIASQLSEYIPIIESFLNLFKNKEDKYICGILDSITFLYYSLGKYKKSLEYQTKSFDIRKELFWEDTEYIAQSYQLLSIIYHSMNELPKALKEQTKALKIREEILDDKHPDLATSYNNISLIYKDMDELQKALEYQNKALKLREDSSPALAISYNNISTIYQAMDNLPQALDYQNKSLKLREDILDNKHPDLAQSYNNISLIYKNMRELPKALKYQNISIEMKEEVLGDKHPDLATSYRNISLIYKNMKKCKKASEFIKKATHIWNQYDYYKSLLFTSNRELKEIEFNIKKEKKIKKQKDKGKFCKDA